MFHQNPKVPTMNPRRNWHITVDEMSSSVGPSFIESDYDVTNRF